MNILLIDDCFEISELVKTSLAHHRVTAVDRIDSAKNTLEQSHFDLLLIDVNLPDGDGFDLLSYLEDDDYYKNVPKIILTSKDQVSYKVHGLEHGADDYITKPFHPLELKARVNLQLEKAHSSEQVIQNSFLKFDLDKQICMIKEKDNWKDLNLTPLELKILLTLVKDSGKIKSRNDLKNHIWGKDKVNIEAKGIDTHIAHIRKKLGHHSNSIVSVYGSGYYFEPNKKTVLAA